MAVVDILLSEYNSIRSEIVDTHKAPERWGSILIAFAGVILGLSITRGLDFIDRRYLIVFSEIPMLIFIIIIYLNIKTIKRLSIIQIRIADELAMNDYDMCLSDEDEGVLNYCASIYENNLLILSWLILFCILFIFFYNFYLVLVQFLY